MRATPLALALLLSAPAWADDHAAAEATAATEEVSLPTGRTVEAEKITDPDEGSIEHSLIASMELIRDEKFDEWIGAWCYQETCPDDRAREQFKTYQLAAASRTVHECMTDDGGVLITRREATDESTRLFVYCGPNRMPAPSAHHEADGSWKVSSFSW